MVIFIQKWKMNAHIVKLLLDQFSPGLLLTLLQSIQTAFTLNKIYPFSRCEPLRPLLYELCIRKSLHSLQWEQKLFQDLHKFRNCVAYCLNRDISLRSQSLTDFQPTLALEQNGTPPKIGEDPFGIMSSFLIYPPYGVLCPKNFRISQSSFIFNSANCQSLFAVSWKWSPVRNLGNSDSPCLFSFSGISQSCAP